MMGNFLFETAGRMPGKSLTMAALMLGAMAAQPASAALQLSIDVNGTTFTCSDGASCDQSSANKNLLVIDQTVAGVLVQVTLAQSTIGAVNELQLSSSNIENLTNLSRSITIEAGDTGFLNPVTFIRDSGSLTFNDAVGSLASSLSFFADAGNGQGAPGTPGTLLEQVFGTPLTDPDSFAGTNFAAFLANSPFSMTEEAALNLRAGGSITGLNQSMTSGVPEPKTWAMMGIGFGLMAMMGFKRRKNRLGAFA